MATPMCESTSKSFSTEEGSCSGESSRFSTAITTPSAVWIPMAVVPILIACCAPPEGGGSACARTLCDVRPPPSCGRHGRHGLRPAGGGSVRPAHLHRVLDLEETAFRRKGIDAAVVLTPRQEHGCALRARGEADGPSRWRATRLRRTRRPEYFFKAPHNPAAPPGSARLFESARRTSGARARV